MSNENNTKTGFQAWCEENGVPDKYVLMLLKAEDRDPRQFLGDAIEMDVPLPSGRGEALKLLLGRGRAGEIEIPHIVADDILGVSVPSGSINSKDALGLAAGSPEIFKAPAPAADIGNTEDSGKACITGEKYDIEGQAGQVDVDAAAEVPASVVIPAARPAARKKTKYSITKASFENLGFSADNAADMPSGTVRQFLLSAGYKAQDIAVMPDSEVAAAFGKDYVLAHFGCGCLILDRPGFDRLRELLVSEGYYIPRPAPEEGGK